MTLEELEVALIETGMDKKVPVRLAVRVRGEYGDSYEAEASDFAVFIRYRPALVCGECGARKGQDVQEIILEGQEA